MISLSDNQDAAHEAQALLLSAIICILIFNSRL